MVPRSFGLIRSGTDPGRWQSQLLGATDSVHEAAVQTVLSVELPYLAGADLATVCKIKDDNADLFGRFRRELQRRVLEARQLEGDQLTVGTLADRLQHEWLDDGVRKLEAKLTRESQKRWAAKAGVVYATGSLVLSALLQSPLPTLVAAGGGALLALAKGLIEHDELYSSDKSELYAFWQIKHFTERKGRSGRQTKSRY